MNAIDRIAEVDGIDMLFIGPNDLSGTLGELGNYTTDSFRDAFERIGRAAGNAGKFLGTIPLPGWSAQTLFRAGHQLVISGADSMLLLEAAKADVRRLLLTASPGRNFGDYVVSFPGVCPSNRNRFRFSSSLPQPGAGCQAALRSRVSRITSSATFLGQGL